MRYLIFVPEAGGHHLEYTNHLVALAERNTENEYIFCVHSTIKNNQDFLLYGYKVANIKVYEILKIELPTSKGYFRHSYELCKLLKTKARMYKAEKIFLIMIMPFSPFIFLPIWGGLKISGIVYKIYLYGWKRSSFIHKVYDVVRFWLATKCKHIEKIFILNDELASKIFNRKYRSDKFIYIVDPYFPIAEKVNNQDLYTICNEKKIISHIGVLKERKGTYEILKAINKETTNLFKDNVFIFAGKPENEERFRQELNRAKEYAQIIFYNGFLPFNEIGNIVKNSYCLLLPYHNTDQSSGMIGYAAQYGIPVVVPKENLLKKLVLKYKLGYFLRGKSSKDIVCFFKENKDLKNTGDNLYCTCNNIDNFIKIINNNI